MNLRILQWNVFYKEDPQKVAREIQRLDADIVCAQELIQHFGTNPPMDTAKLIAERIGYKHLYIPADSWSGRDAKENQGNAIFSRYPILGYTSTHVQEAKHNPPDAEHEGRVYIQADIEIEGRTLTLGTTHLSYSHGFVVSDHRKIEVANLIQILSTKDSNFVFTGDLNSIPDSHTIKSIEAETNLVHAGPEYDEPSWTTKPFSYHGFEEDKLRWRLDYVFTTPDLAVTNSQIVATVVSDHLPILTEIDW